MIDKPKPRRIGAGVGGLHRANIHTAYLAPPPKCLLLSAAVFGCCTTPCCGACSKQHAHTYASCLSACFLLLYGLVKAADIDPKHRELLSETLPVAGFEVPLQVRQQPRELLPQPHLVLRGLRRDHLLLVRIEVLDNTRQEGEYDVTIKT